MSCLDVFDVCPICRTAIETAIRSLATIANKCIYSWGNSGDSDGSHSTRKVDTTAGDDDSRNKGDDDDELLISSVNANVDQILKNLTLQIWLFLSDHNQFSYYLQQLTAHHHHNRYHASLLSSRDLPTAAPVVIYYKVNKGCWQTGHPVSLVQFASLTYVQERDIPHHVLVSDVPDNYKQILIQLPLSLSHGPSAVRQTHVSADVTEWLISLYQSTVTSGQMGSNAVQ